MDNFWWFVHIFGLSLWFGSTMAVLFVWPKRPSSAEDSSSAADIPTLVRVLNRSTHTGAGLTALGGTVLSFYVQPKSDLGSLWLATMQGLGVIAFVLSVIVLTRIGKRLNRLISAESAEEEYQHTCRRYHTWLWWTFILLLICLLMAAFKPVL